MDQSTASPALIKSALFVDFDNIYIGLSKSEPQAAERFASDPAHWLAWLEKGLPASPGSGGVLRPRSILIRRCYPNPDAGFRRFRSYFTSAAFSVIDCPSLTRTGKNSSDIYMLMDILDALEHKTYFDEFIIFSGDSDFMPVLLRLRAHDRRTTTLAIDFMPPAYKAACDLVISEEEFIEEALGVSPGAAGGANQGRGRVSVNLLKDMASRVFQTTLGGGEVVGADLPDILKDFREFRDSTNWLGFGTSQRLAEALVCAEPRLELVRLNSTLYKIALKPPSPKPEATPARGSASHPAGRPARQPERPAQAEGTPETPGGEKTSKAELARLRSQILSIVLELVASSPQAILLARASQHVVSQLGARVLETQWAGAGSFKRLLQSVNDPGLEITTQPEPGYVFDPRRHLHPGLSRGQVAAALELPASPGGSFSEDAQKIEPEEQEAVVGEVPAVETGQYLSAAAPGEYGQDEEDEEDEGNEDYSESLPSLDEFIERVSRVTGVPHLTTGQYWLAFRGIVHELQQISTGEKVYNTYQSSKSVSEWCAGQGEAISRSDLVLIFKGIIFQDGVRFGKRPGSYTELDLAKVVLNNIRALCRRARLELSEYEVHLLEEWILGDEASESLYGAPEASSSGVDSPEGEMQQVKEASDE